MHSEVPNCKEYICIVVQIALLQSYFHERS